MARQPDGAYHARITIVLAVTVLPVAFVLTRDWELALAAWLGCMAGLIITPDLDLIGLSYAETIWLKVPMVGWLIMGLWFVFWTPYSIWMGLYGGHRGLSHHPITGTLTRVAYLAVPTVLLLSLYGWLLPALEGWPYWLAGIAGLCCADLGHWLRDYKGLEI